MLEAKANCQMDVWPEALRHERGDAAASGLGTSCNSQGDSGGRPPAGGLKATFIQNVVQWYRRVRTEQAPPRKR